MTVKLIIGNFPSPICRMRIKARLFEIGNPLGSIEHFHVPVFVGLSLTLFKNNDVTGLVIGGGHLGEAKVAQQVAELKCIVWAMIGVLLWTLARAEVFAATSVN